VADVTRSLDKVTCLITRRSDDGDEFVVFDHPLSGVQVPAGTSPPGEGAREAALREGTEETGIPRLGVEAELKAVVEATPPIMVVSSRFATRCHCPELLDILVAMSAVEHLPLADVKNRLSEVIDRLEREHGRIVVTKHGRPAAVMLSVEDLESLEETLEILSNPRLLDEIRRGNRDMKAGRTERLSRDELLARRASK